MTTVYRKSAKGQQEIETRINRLSPRLRMALILVDGRRSAVELRTLIQLEADSTLLALLEGGYIEIVSTLAAPVATATVPTVVPVVGSAAVSAAALAERRQLAVRHLTDHLGPVVEELAMRIEKARTWDELLPQLMLGRSVLHTSRGAAAAARFAERFIDQPLG